MGNHIKEWEQHLYNPHQFLGLHEEQGNKIIRLYRPGAKNVRIELFGRLVDLKEEGGLFVCTVPPATEPHNYRVYHQNGLLAQDPYAFLPTFGDMDAYLFSRGVHYKLYEILGARVCTHGGVRGTKFSVWAPNAKRVSLVADFNYWDGRVNPMRSMGFSGVWELFVPGIEEGEKYKFEIHTEDGGLKVKADPYATFSELRPKSASVVFDVDHFSWTDQAWISRQWDKASFPLNIYEVHLGSWRKDGREMGYVEMARELAMYCKEMGFSHVELMPIAEHPLDESWGYQVTGYYSVTSRFGTPRDFQHFVNTLHENGIGVLLDWVAAHFPTDDHALAQFDGTFLYEHADPRKGYHPHWGTNIFNYGRAEVANFLIANALFWMDKMHIDGLRVDAVASMLYLDYGRDGGEWIPNQWGGKENVEAIEFLKHLNSVVHARFPNALMFAEESTAYTGVSHSLDSGGLGFDMKWNMGWMNDTLRYMSKDPVHRSYHHNDLTFGLLYAFSERFVLPLSHDEVVHEKASLLAKMPGDDWQKFANLRLLYSYMICQPGKKLLFMGGEFGQWYEWSCKDPLSWNLLQYDRHQMLQKFFKEINHFYHAHPALWTWDFDGRGFEWIDFSDRANSTISYLRKSAHQYLFCVHNFTPNYVPEYFIRLSHVKSIKEVFNTDRLDYWGSGKINPNVAVVDDPTGRKVGVQIHLAPLATMVFDVEFST